MGRVPPRYNKSPAGKFQYVAKPLENYPDDWLVEAVNYDAGCTYLTVFEGRDAGARATEYARFKNEQLGVK